MSSAGQINQIDDLGIREYDDRPRRGLCQGRPSPAATEDAIRLLDGRQSGVESVERFGDILDAGPRTGSSSFAVKAPTFAKATVGSLRLPS
jgi:hypothetical protein